MGQSIIALLPNFNENHITHKYIASSIDFTGPASGVAIEEIVNENVTKQKVVMKGPMKTTSACKLN